MPLVRGRGFEDVDGATGAETVIINEQLADQFFRGEDPIGRPLRFTQRNPAPGQSPGVWRTVIGIASSSIRHGSPEDAYVNSVVYIPYRHEAPGAVSLLIRSAGPPAALTDAVRREVGTLDRDQPVFAAQTFDEILQNERWWHRLLGSVFGILAGIALVLSGVGVYAVMAYAVAQRTPEIGVRMALGAQTRQISWLILKRGLRQLVAGLAIGLPAACRTRTRLAI